MPRDHQPLCQQLSVIASFATELEPLSATPWSQYTESPVLRRAVERLVQLTVEAITDSADEVLKEAGREPSDVGRESIAQLAALGVISQLLARELMRTTGLRNRLVHAYQRIDDERVLAASGDLVRWARQYVHATEAWLSKHEDTEK